MREMKDSSIEWIGEIPKDWKVTILSALFSERKCKNKGLIENNLLSLSYGNIIRKNISSNEGLLPISFETYNIIENGNIVFRLTDLQNDKRSLRTGLCKEQGIITSAYITLQTIKNDSPKYMHYLFHTYDLCKVFYGMGDGVRQSMNYEDLKRLRILRPSIEQQNRIANYLDKKCSKIDEIISKQQTVIEKLKEYKLSIITEAVTKGLNPDVTMKDSGVEWIGEIPEHWEVVKLKYLIDYIESGVSVNAGLEKATVGEIGVLKTSSVSKFEFDVNENKSVNRNEENRVACPVVENTIIVSRMNTPELVGACGYVNKSYNNIYLPDRLWQVHFYNDINVKYIWYYLRCKTVRNYYASLATGTSSSMQNISQGQFSNVYVALPIKDQQKQITDYLDSKCEKIDFTINKKQKLIDKLTEYKKSLIYEVVTGKKEV